jgi:uncharacterized membrane protein
MAIVTLSLAVIFAVLAIDVGRLGWEAGRLQKIADLAAVDAVAEAGLCSGVTTLDQTALEAAAQASALRNEYAGDPDADIDLVVGTLATVDHLRTFVPGVIGDANAVQVTARHTINSSLVAGGWLGGTTTQERQAIAFDEVNAGFSAGSFLVSVNSDDALVLNAVLGGLLGGSVNLSAASYEGLASAQVTLEALATASGPGGAGVSAGTVEGFLQTRLTAGEFLEVMATALTSGHAAYADINGMVGIASNVNDFAVGDLISVTTDHPESAGAIAFNVLDLVSGVAQISNEGETINLSMALNLPLGLSTVTVSLHVIEGPQYAFGPPGVDSGGDWKTQVRTSHLQLEIGVVLTGGLPILGGLVDVSGALYLYLDAAPASAWLETIQCANAATLTHIVDIGLQTGISELGLGRFDDITDPDSGTGSTPTLNVEVALGLASLTAEVSATSQIFAGQAAQLSFAVNKASPVPQTRTAGTSLGDSLNSATSSLAATLEVEAMGGGLLLGTVGLSVPAIKTGLSDELLSPLLLDLDELLLDPLLRALGIHLNGADVKLHSIQRGAPRLAG